MKKGEIAKNKLERAQLIQKANQKAQIIPNHTKLTIGQKAADTLTRWAGSWAFIIGLAILIIAWIFLNIKAYIGQWDPWPFIILNLILSCLAAIQAPIILMSQNRETQRDRLRQEYDYAVNRKAEKEIQRIREQLDKIEKHLSKKRK